MKPSMRHLLSIGCGCLLIAFAIHFFIVPYHLIEGGMFGIGLLASYMSAVSSGMAIVALSIPIYIFTWFYSRTMLGYNLLGIVTIAVLLDLLDMSGLAIGLGPLPSAWCGGVLIGAGVGILLHRNMTTDGIDLLATLFSRYARVNVGVLIFLFDLVILAASALVLAHDQIVLSGITVTAVGFVTTLLTLRRPHDAAPT
ncbi:YitT family protein [Paenibacillus sp. IB182496]|uniref:YitT family protein n=1 Tax=Paenibacillus sabuli TaxID=2772509 RepID=A0A927BWQ8_9BACL|nr:YitT family protein [Paenibacillus sabuli]MBD2846758.1 YitT family protein [Paenibacillus sabuli]